MLGRLTELMFVEILREYMQRLTDNEGGWLAGVNDAHQADDARGGAQSPGRRDTRRLRLRSRLQPRIQACDRLAAGDLAQRRARRGSSAQA
jgi:hypothetical protein